MSAGGLARLFGVLALAAVALDHRLGLIDQTLAGRDALAELPLILFHFSGLAVAPGCATCLVRDKNFLSRGSTIQGVYRSMLETVW